MARLSKEITLTPDYIGRNLNEVAASVVTAQSRILEMISDPEIEIDANEMRNLATSVATIRDTSDALYRLLEAFRGRIESEADLRSRLEKLEKGKAAKTAA